MSEEKTLKNKQRQADELEERLINFAVRIVNLSSRLPKTPAGRHIAGQIMRAGTSPAPNYGEARGAESHADFVHKVRIVLKELNETAIWLRIIESQSVVTESVVDRHYSRKQRIVQNLYIVFENGSTTLNLNEEQDAGNGQAVVSYHVEAMSQTLTRTPFD